MIAELREPCALFGHDLTADLVGAAEADDERHREGPRPHPALVSTAVDQRRDAHPRRLAPNVERAHALRAVDQVRGTRQEIDPRRLYVHRNLADRLRRVGVEDDPPLLGQLPDRRHVLDRADLVVREHDRDEDRLVRDRLADRVELHQTVRPHGHVRRLEALPLQALTDVQARPLLDGGGDDVVALFPVHLGDALDREIDRLGPPGSEDDFLGIPGADDLRDLIPRAVDGVLGLPTERARHRPALDSRGVARPRVSTLGAVLADDEPPLREALKDLREQLGRNPELLGDPLRADGAEAVVRGDIVDRHQPVICALRKAEHRLYPQVLPNTLQWQGPIADSFDRRLFQSYSHTRPAFRQLERAGMTENPASEPGDTPGRQWAIRGASRLLRAFPDIYDSAQHTEVGARTQALRGA